jgi:hypothetical protein
VSSSGAKGQGFGFRVAGSEKVGPLSANRPGVVRGWGFGFRLSAFGFRVSGFGFRVSGFGFRAKHRVGVARDDHPSAPGPSKKCEFLFVWDGPRFFVGSG